MIDTNKYIDSFVWCKYAETTATVHIEPYWNNALKMEPSISTTEAILNDINKVDKEKNEKMAEEKFKQYEENKRKQLVEKFTPKYIQQKGRHTIVKWADDTVTHVAISEADAAENGASEYSAFCAALAKKIFGSNSAIHRLVNEHDTVYIEKQKAMEKKKARLAADEEKEKAHESKVKKVAKELRLIEEAKQHNKKFEFKELFKQFNHERKEAN